MTNRKKIQNVQENFTHELIVKKRRLGVLILIISVINLNSNFYGQVIEFEVFFTPGVELVTWKM